MATAPGSQSIGSLKPGEKVWAYNTKTQKMELEPVLHVWINHDDDLVDLTLSTPTTAKKGMVSEVIHTNKKHPFLTQEQGFVQVSDLHVGMHVREANGSYGDITGWYVVPGTMTMYNLEVQQDHTYTVGDGQWVVHNSDCSGFLNVKKLLYHFGKHAQKFSPAFTSADEYENAGKAFMSGEEVADDVHQASIYHPGSIFHGDLVRYAESTNTFGEKAANGVLRTFYPPENGIEHFYETLSH